MSHNNVALQVDCIHVHVFYHLCCKLQLQVELICVCYVHVHVHVWIVLESIVVCVTMYHYQAIHFVHATMHSNFIQMYILHNATNLYDELLCTLQSLDKAASSSFCFNVKTCSSCFFFIAFTTLSCCSFALVKDSERLNSTNCWFRLPIVVSLM